MLVGDDDEYSLTNTLERNSVKHEQFMHEIYYMATSNVKLISLLGLGLGFFFVHFKVTLLLAILVDIVENTVENTKQQQQQVIYFHTPHTIESFG
jgi:hypothetical protein